jgi:hypothetical protein
MRRAVIAISFAFAVALAVVVGNRMSTEAMAVVVGVVCGVAAGIPMSMLILLALNRRDRQTADLGYGQLGRRSASYPPVVVIQGGSPMPSQVTPPYYSAPVATPEPAQRPFRIIGEE